VVSVIVAAIEEGRLLLTHDVKCTKLEPEVGYGKWLVDQCKQAPNIHTHVCNGVTLVRGSLRLTPIIGGLNLT